MTLLRIFKGYRELEANFKTAMEAKANVIKEVHELKYKGMRTLTHAEAEMLWECLGTLDSGGDIRMKDFIHSASPLISNLAKKGYLTRVKRGEYKLTFVK